MEKEIEFLTLREAREKGLIKYYSKTVCKRSHYPCLRNTSKSECLECKKILRNTEEEKEKTKLRGKKYLAIPEIREKNKQRCREFREKNPNYNKEYNANYYKNNTEKIRNQTNKYYTQNRENIKFVQKGYYINNKEKILEQHKEYRSRPEVKNRYIETNKNWRKNNPAKFIAITRWRKLAKIQRTPKWANKNAIAKFYEEARRLTRETGIQHHVDHILPLQGKLVSGLHVETNLRVITASENLSKHNKLIEELL